MNLEDVLEQQLGKMISAGEEITAVDLAMKTNQYSRLDEVEAWLMKNQPPQNFACCLEGCINWANRNNSMRCPTLAVGPIRLYLCQDHYNDLARKAIAQKMLESGYSLED